MLGNKVVVLGGAGFVGRAVVNELSKQGFETSVCVRRLERYREYALYPNTKLVELSEYSDEALNQVMSGQDILVNLIADVTTGTESVEIGQQVEVTQRIKQVVDHAGIQRVMQLSQIGADATQQQNAYLSALGQADAIITNATAAVTILKAGLLIGDGDETTSRFNAQLNRLPLLPVYQSGRSVQPLGVADFAQAFVGSIKQSKLANQKVEVVGEQRLSLKELAEMVKEVKGEDEAFVLPMCGLNAKIMSFLGRFSPVCSVSKEQSLILSADLVSEQDFSTLFGFVPSSLESLLSSSIAPHHIRARYNDFRQDAGRDAEELI